MVDENQMIELAMAMKDAARALDRIGEILLEEPGKPSGRHPGWEEFPAPHKGYLRSKDGRFTIMRNYGRGSLYEGERLVYTGSFGQCKKIAEEMAKDGPPEEDHG